MFEWINVEAFEIASCRRPVLFGAGRGAEELIEHIRSNGLDVRIQGIIDNDSSFWGRRLAGIPIAGISDLSSFDFDRIVVTSISGREAIACQLEREGYRYPDDYILIGRYPADWRSSYLKLCSSLAGQGGVAGKRCLHIGPGGFLGLEVLLYCFGAASVTSIDKFTFGIHYPEVTTRFDDYLNISKQLGQFASDADTINRADNRFDGLFFKKNGNVCIDPEKIHYLYPEDVCAMPFADSSFDVVFSFGVLEHARLPEKAAAEISRVLKPGGVSFHRIITADHRSFSGFDEFDAFSFRTYSHRKWDEISSRKFFQNRILPVEWRNFFKDSGHHIDCFSVDSITGLSKARINSFSSEFKKFTEQELGQVNCEILSRKITGL